MPLKKIGFQMQSCQSELGPIAQQPTGADSSQKVDLVRCGPLQNRLRQRDLRG